MSRQLKDMTPEERREYNRIAKRKQRAKDKAARILQNDPDRLNRQKSATLNLDQLQEPPWPAEPARAVADWCAARLKVPAGRLRGKPFLIPGWQLQFLEAALAGETTEAWLSCARKNGKSGLIAAVLLAFLAPDGPLRRNSWRAIAVSLTGQLSQELRRQVQEIAEASEVEGLEFMRSPTPGRIIGVSGTVDFLAADKASGHAAGADLAIIDEAGLLSERKRHLWDAVVSSVSGRDGTVIGISIQGDGPMFAEAMERAGQAGVHVVRYAAPTDCDLDSVEAWEAANPGLESGIKSYDYMSHRARTAIDQPSSAPGFRALDLNQPVSPEKEMLVDLAEWLRCETDTPPARGGRCYLGVDLGGSLSLTAAVACWDSGRMEVWVAVPRIPGLAERGRADGVGALYVQAAEDGFLQVLGDRVTDAGAFLERVLADLGGHPTVIGCDRYRKAELLDVLSPLGLTSAVRWRGTGASATADGSHDVRSFQRAVKDGEIGTLKNPMVRVSLGSTAIRRDGSGNPAIDKSKWDSRIDIAAAAVIAYGLRAIAQHDADQRSLFAIAG